MADDVMTEDEAREAGYVFPNEIQQDQPEGQMTEDEARAAGYVYPDEIQQTQPEGQMTEKEARAAGYVYPDEIQQDQTGILGAIPKGVAGGFKSLAGGARELGGERTQATEAGPSFTGTPAELTYGLFRSAPALIAGLGAGVAGTLVGGPVAGLAAGALGFGAIQGIQDLFTEYQAALPKYKGDTDAAFNEAMKTASISAGGSAVSWAAFPLGGAGGSILKHIIIQAGTVQPGIGVATRAASNLAKGDDVTEGLLQAGAQNALLTAGLMGAHAAVTKTVGAIKGQPKPDTFAPMGQEQPEIPGLENESTLYKNQADLNLQPPEQWSDRYAKQTDLSLQSPQLVEAEQGELRLPQGEVPIDQRNFTFTGAKTTPDTAGTAASQPRPQGASRPATKYPKDNEQGTGTQLNTGPDPDRQAALLGLSSEQTQAARAAAAEELPLVQRPPFPENEQQPQLPMPIPPEVQGKLPLPEPYPVAQPDHQLNLKEETQLPLLPPGREQLSPAAEAERASTQPPAAEAAIAASKAPRITNPVNRFLRGIIDPSSASPEARQMATIIRKYTGRKNRILAGFKDRADEFEKIFNEAPPQLDTDFQIAVNTGQPAPRADLQPLADVIREYGKGVEADLKKLPGQDKQKFIQDHFPQMWENEGAARTFTQNWYKNVGSAGSMEERAYPNIPAGIAAGMKLKRGAISNYMNYLTSMRSYIADLQIRDKLTDEGGLGIFVDNPSPAASGNPDISNVPAGYAPLNGPYRGGTIYVPEEAATVYNNFITKAFAGFKHGEKIADGIQRATNMATAVELMLNVFHFSTESMESFITQIGRGISDTLSGKVVSGSKTIGSAPLAPYTSYKAGKGMETHYLNEQSGSPEEREIIRLLTDVNAPMIGSKYDPTVQYGKGESYVRSAYKGALTKQLQEAKDNISQAEGAQGKAIAATKEGIDAFGRLLTTLADPLFNVYIPRLKLGINSQTLMEWLARNPTATEAQKLQAAQRIVDSTDNAVGEMVYDNLFLNATLKKVLQIGMRSPSWFIGTVKQLGGGTAQLIRHPSSASYTSPHYDARAAYALAFPIGTAFANSVYQFLKTGQPPTTITDLIAPLTGGTTIAGQPERAQLPSYEKEIIGWFGNPTKEAYNKLGVVPRLMVETALNKDWRDLVIANPSDPFQLRLAQYAQHAAESMNPISIKNMVQGGERGTKLSTLDRALALRAAPKWIQDPEGVTRQQAIGAHRQVQARDRADRKQLNRREP